MNEIKRLQKENARQAEVIAEYQTAMQDIREYCSSAKFSEPLATMNPADIIHRVGDWKRRINDIADNGRAIVDDLRGGYTHEALQAAFTAVHDPADWRAPIRTFIDAAVLDITKTAVEFFTATKVRVAATTDPGRLAIEADGYRAGPAGDH